MRILTAILATLTSLTLSLGIAQAVSAPAQPSVAVIALQPLWQADRLDPIQPIRYRHGDVSWLPKLPQKAGGARPNRPLPMDARHCNGAGRIEARHQGADVRVRACECMDGGIDRIGCGKGRYGHGERHQRKDGDPMGA